MVIKATSKYSVIRGTTISEYGDEMDGDTVVYTAIRGSVVQRSKTIYSPDSGRVELVVFYTGRFPHGTDIVQGDRIKDERTNKKYVVLAANGGSDFINKSDLTLDLEIN